MKMYDWINYIVRRVNNQEYCKKIKRCRSDVDKNWEVFYLLGKKELYWRYLKINKSKLYKVRPSRRLIKLYVLTYANDADLFTKKIFGQAPKFKPLCMSNFKNFPMWKLDYLLGTSSSDPGDLSLPSPMSDPHADWGRTKYIMHARTTRLSMLLFVNPLVPLCRLVLHCKQLLIDNFDVGRAFCQEILKC